MTTAHARDWFDQADHRPQDRGLRFSCTLCGACCTGPEGFVLFTPAEARGLAARIGVSVEAFIRDFTHDTPAGRSLGEVRTEHGMDCIFLDRRTVPGRAVCGVYHERPAQCRTWPFWESNLADEGAWKRAARKCPGIGGGTLHPPAVIRLTRDRVAI